MSRVALIGNNSVEYVEKLLSIWNNNDSAVLIDYDTPPSIAFAMLSEVGAGRCYIENSLTDMNDAAPPTLKTTQYSILNEIPCVLPKSVRDLFKPRYDESEAVVIFSSGTTGKRKGISLSHRAINNNADSIIEYICPTDSDTFYLNKKLTHCSSLIGELIVSLKSGAGVVLSQIVVPPRTAFRNIADFHVTVLCCNPMLIKLYADEAERTETFPECVRAVYTSGDVISEKEIERARTVFHRSVYNVYGQSECGPRISAQTREHCNGNSAGKAIKNVEIRIDENGEILVRTNALFSGYTNSDEKPEEWHRTGDIGYIGNNGDLYVTGRTDNMIVIGAHNIFPETIEDTIIDKTDVDDCVIFKEDGKLICEYTAKECLDTEITRSIKPLLMPYEVPKLYRRVEAIVRNKNGKKIRNRNQREAHEQER